MLPEIWWLRTVAPPAPGPDRRRAGRGNIFLPGSVASRYLKPRFLQPLVRGR